MTGQTDMTDAFDLTQYLNSLIAGCVSAFGERLLYAGLQGSHMRGEAKEDSDIDVMIVIDALSPEDMAVYRGILGKTGHYDRSCGFICGRDELSSWNPLEICHLRHTTKDLYGSLEGLLPEASRKDEIDFVRLSLGNIYHELCHRYIHSDREKNVSRFRGSCKALFFLIQNLRYLETGVFAVSKRELKDISGPEDREMLDMPELPDGYDFDAAFSAAFRWCQNAFRRIDAVS